MLPTSRIVKLRADAELFRSYGVQDLASILDKVAQDLEADFEELDLTCLSLDEASEESGYSIGHLRRLLGLEPGFEAKIPNEGTAADPRILRAHLPKKPGHGVVSVAPPLVSDVTSLRQAARAVADGGWRRAQ